MSFMDYLDKMESKKQPKVVEKKVIKESVQEKVETKAKVPTTILEHANLLMGDSKSTFKGTQAQNQNISHVNSILG